MSGQSDRLRRETRDEGDAARYAEQGYLLRPAVLGPDEIARLCAELEALAGEARLRRRQGQVFAVRDAAAISPRVHALTEDARLVSLASRLLGAPATCRKTTLFDKRPEANWSLRLHQDLVIAVQRREPVPGYGPWSEKAGTPHVRPPAAVLERCVALRLHLDPCPAGNGALHVVPASHTGGRLPRARIAELRSAQGEVACAADAGDVLAMSPLLLHGSPRAEHPARRRVLHFEYSACELAPPLEWAWPRRRDEAPGAA